MNDARKTYPIRPCACGTGSVYGHWCLTPDDPEHASLSPVWGIDVRSVTPHGQPNPMARTMAVLVVSGQTLLYANPVINPSSDVDEFTALLHAALEAAERSTRITPAAVFVRNPDVAELLGDQLSPRGIPVAAVARPSSASCVGDEYDAALSAGRRTPQVAPPPLWSTWSVSPSCVSRLFSAAASFHDAEPWMAVDDENCLVIDTTRGTTLYAAVLGANRRGTKSTKRPGLVLSACEDDLELGMHDDQNASSIASLRAAGTPADAIPNRFAKPCAWLTFEPATELPPAMHAEIVRMGWRVRPNAFPRVIAMNTPADGMADTDIMDLVDVLEALPRFLDAQKMAKHTHNDKPVERTDPFNGVTLRLHKGWLRELNQIRRTKRSHDVTVFSCGPSGPHARPGQYFTTDDDLVDCAATERALVDDILALEMDGDDDTEHAAVPSDEQRKVLDALVDYMVFQVRAPIAAITALDLSHFLDMEWPRHTDSFIETRRMLDVLRDLFAHLTVGGIFCRFYTEVLADEQGLGTRCIRYAKASESPDALADWMSEIEAALRPTWLTPRSRLTSGGINWRKANGPKGRALWHELSRTWLKWRDEIVHAGVNCMRTPLIFLVACQRQWERAPHAGYGGLSPAEVVAEEAGRGGRA